MMPKRHVIGGLLLYSTQEMQTVPVYRIGKYRDAVLSPAFTGSHETGLSYFG